MPRPREPGAGVGTGPSAACSSARLRSRWVAGWAATHPARHALALGARRAGEIAAAEVSPNRVEPLPAAARIGGAQLPLPVSGPRRTPIPTPTPRRSDNGGMDAARRAWPTINHEEISTGPDRGDRGRGIDPPSTLKIARVIRTAFEQLKSGSGRRCRVGRTQLSVRRPRDRSAHELGESTKDLRLSLARRPQQCCHADDADHHRKADHCQPPRPRRSSVTCGRLSLDPCSGRGGRHTSSLKRTWRRFVVGVTNRVHHRRGGPGSDRTRRARPAPRHCAGSVCSPGTPNRQATAGCRHRCP